MYYKTNWKWRFELEMSKLKKVYPEYEILSTNSNRNRNYSTEEIEKIVSLKNQGLSDNAIAEEVNRTYWSIVYKVREMKKDGLL